MSCLFNSPLLFFLAIWLDYPLSAQGTLPSSPPPENNFGLLQAASPPFSLSTVSPSLASYISLAQARDFAVRRLPFSDIPSFSHCSCFLPFLRSACNFFLPGRLHFFFSLPLCNEPLTVFRGNPVPPPFPFFFGHPFFFPLLGEALALCT